MSDLESRLKNLKEEIEDTKSKSITLKANAEKEEEILRDLVKEIRDMGFDPKTLKEDIAEMEKSLLDKVSEKEKEVEQVKATLLDIERNVKSHEVS